MKEYEIKLKTAQEDEQFQWFLAQSFGEPWPWEREDGTQNLAYLWRSVLYVTTKPWSDYLISKSQG